MIYAELKSKIPKIHKSEDVLTSNVFGFLKVLPQVQILNIIRAIVPQHIAHQLADRKLTKFCLWKKFVNLKEPDVYMKLDPEYHIFIEIKYLSPESGDTQLRDYLDLIEGENKVLIYLTADRTEPVWTTQNDIYEGLPICWTNWHKLKSVLERFARNEDNEIVQKIYCLIAKYLDYKGFSYFSGWPTGDMRKYMQRQPVIWSYGE